MAEEVLNKELADKLMKIKGEARGIHFKNDAEFILKKGGREALLKVEEELKKLGYPLEYEKIKNFDFLPAGLRALSLLAAKKILDLNNEGIKEMCAFAVSTSFVIKLYSRFFHSIDYVLKRVSSMWEEYWSVGSCQVEEHNEKEGYLILKIEGLNLIPEYCRCLEGYLGGLAKMVVKSEKITCLEIECPFLGGKNHRFFIRYK